MSRRIFRIGEPIWSFIKEIPIIEQSSLLWNILSLRDNTHPNHSEVHSADVIRHFANTKTSKCYNPFMDVIGMYKNKETDDYLRKKEMI